MTHPNKISLSREDLYERVWSVPMSKLCKEFGLSDKGLAKICHRYDIPLPGRSYWGRKNIGQIPPKPPLPAMSEAVPVTIIKPKPQRKMPSTPTIIVPLKLKDPHPLIIKTKELLDKIATTKGRTYPHDMSSVLEITVSKNSASRALRIMETIIKEIEARGGSIEVSNEKGTRIKLRGQSLQIHMQELTKRIFKKGVSASDPSHLYSDYEFPPTGNLLFKIDAHCNRLQNTFQDGVRAKIEDRVGEIIGNIELFADYYFQREIERRKEEVLWREREERRRIEENKIERLKNEMLHWEESRKIKSYLRAICRENKSPQDLNKNEWIDWIKGYLAKREESLLVQDRPLYPENRRMW